MMSERQRNDFSRNIKANRKGSARKFDKLVFDRIALIKTEITEFSIGSILTPRFRFNRGAARNFNDFIKKMNFI
jgi:hypothetical protein